MSNVMTIDPWQIIYDKAGDLVDAILHEQPKNEFDAIDFEDAINSKAEEIVWRGVNPEDDWSVVIRQVKKGAKLDEQIEEHFQIALRQGVFVRMLYEGDMRRVIKNYTESSQSGEIFDLGNKMISAFSCAQQHATAWRLLKEVRDRSYEVRNEKAQTARNENKEEREILLRGLVKGVLTMPEANLWPGLVITAQMIAEELSPLVGKYNLPLQDNEDKLFDQIYKIIFREPSLRKAYNENAKHPLEEPTKVRKVGKTRVVHSRDSGPIG